MCMYVYIYVCVYIYMYVCMSSSAQPHMHMKSRKGELLRQLLVLTLCDYEMIPGVNQTEFAWDRVCREYLYDTSVGFCLIGT